MNTQSLIHADIFFLVTTVVVAVLGIVLIIAAAYLIKILRDLDRFQKKMSLEAHALVEEVKDLKDELVRKGFRYAKPLGFLTGLFTSLVGRRRRRRRDE